MNGYAETTERKDLTAWRERRMHEAAARKPRNRARYTRKAKHQGRGW